MRVKRRVKNQYTRGEQNFFNDSVFFLRTPYQNNELVVEKRKNNLSTIKIT